MPDASAYPARYNYFHPNHRLAREGANARSDGLCQSCGGMKATEAHHFARPYRHPEDVTADDLSMFCWCCHDTTHDFIFFILAGGSPEEFRAIVSEAVANALLRRLGFRSDVRVGRPRRLGDDWAALVSGGSRPQPGEVVWLFLHSRRKWADVVVTDVVAGRPGCWLVRKRWRDAVEPVCCVRSFPVLVLLALAWSRQE